MNLILGDISNVLFQNADEHGNSNITILFFVQSQKYNNTVILDYEKH